MSLSEARGFFWGIRCPEEKQDRIRMTQMIFLQLNSLCSWTKRMKQSLTQLSKAEWSVVKGYKHRGKLSAVYEVFVLGFDLSEAKIFFTKWR